MPKEIARAHLHVAIFPPLTGEARGARLAPWAYPFAHVRMRLPHGVVLPRIEQDSLRGVLENVAATME